MSETAPTDHEELRDTVPPEADEAEAARVMATMLPPGTPTEARVDTSDNLLSALIADIAAAARLMVNERDERAQAAAEASANQAKIITQQEEIIGILQRTERTGEANHKLLLDSIRRLEQSDSTQNGKLAHHADEIGAMRDEIAAITRRLDELESKAGAT